MKIRHASPPPLRSALDTLAAVATSSDGLATGSEVKALMLRTPRSASLSRSASTPLSKAGLLFSPAISTARHRSAGTGPATGTIASSGARATGDGALSAGSVVQEVARKRSAARRARTRTNMPFCSLACCCLLRLRSRGAQRHVGIEPGHLLLAEVAARTVPHRHMGALVEQCH